MAGKKAVKGPPNYVITIKVDRIGSSKIPITYFQPPPYYAVSTFNSKSRSGTVSIPPGCNGTIACLACICSTKLSLCETLEGKLPSYGRWSSETINCSTLWLLTRGNSVGRSAVSYENRVILSPIRNSIKACSDSVESKFLRNDLFQVQNPFPSQSSEKANDTRPS